MSKQLMLDTKKMAEKTAQAVRNLCVSRAEAGDLPIGFSIVFYNPMNPPEERWSYSIYLASNSEDPVDEKAQAEIIQVMEFINEGVKRLMGGEPIEVDMDDYTVRGDLH